MHSALPRLQEFQHPRSNLLDARLRIGERLLPFAQSLRLTARNDAYLTEDDFQSQKASGVAPRKAPSPLHPTESEG